jgi:hypothetical protein
VAITLAIYPRSVPTFTSLLLLALLASAFSIMHDSILLLRPRIAPSLFPTRRAYA